jgi:hypothetical protein
MQPLRGREFCSMMNVGVRGDLEDQMDSLSGVTRSINRLCVSVPPRPPFPPNDICLRGGGFDDRFRSFFHPGRHFRQPSFLATSFSRDVAERFMRRSTMAAKVMWTVRIDSERKCMHVNLVTRRVPGLADEQEYLFAPCE